LRAQAWAWSAGYVLLLGLIAASHGRGGADAGFARSGAGSGGSFRRSRANGAMALWLALAAVPSGLMLSTTTHLTTDIFAMPLLWVIPLGIYLLSFVIAFAERRGAAHACRRWPGWWCWGRAGWQWSRPIRAGLLPVFASVALLFFVCVALHARLYDLRPAPQHLTTSSTCDVGRRRAGRAVHRPDRAAGVRLGLGTSAAGARRRALLPRDSVAD
jgi:hypothetical protein